MANYTGGKTKLGGNPAIDQPKRFVRKDAYGRPLGTAQPVVNIPTGFNPMCSSTNAGPDINMLTPPMTDEEYMQQELNPEIVAQMNA